MSTRRIDSSEVEMQVPEPDDLGVEITIVFQPNLNPMFQDYVTVYPNSDIKWVPADTPEWFWEDGVLYKSSYPPKEGWIWG